jgi:hypothetical protein
VDRGVQRAAEDFIRNLTNADTAEIQRYITEITLNRKLHNRLEENWNNFSKRRYSPWGFSIGTILGTVLYALCRRQKPDIIVETGVASGVSSSYILCALEENKHGELYSIDLPWPETATYPGGYFMPDSVSPIVPSEKQSGWIIPDYLKHRWQLILGRSSEKLAPLLRKLGEIDGFLHDSEHSYQNMLWEFQTAWAHLKAGGLLLSHNIDMNNAFSHFCQSIGRKSYSLTNMGGVVKLR